MCVCMRMCVWVHGRIGVCVYVCMGVSVYGCLGVWVYGCMWIHVCTLRRPNNIQDHKNQDQKPMTLPPAHANALTMVEHTSSLVFELDNTKVLMEGIRVCCVSYRHLPSLDEYAGVLASLQLQHRLMFYVGMVMCPLFGVLLGTAFVAPSLLGL